MIKIIGLLAFLASSSPVIIARPIAKGPKIQTTDPAEVCNGFATYLSGKSSEAFKCDQMMMAQSKPQLSALGRVTSSQRSFYVLILNDGTTWFVADVFIPK